MSLFVGIFVKGKALPVEQCRRGYVELIGFIKRYIDNKNEKLLKKNVDHLITDPDDYKGKKLVKTKNGQSLYFVQLNIESLEIIKVIGTKGYLGKLTYVFNDSEGQRSINIGDIQHKPVNQGIGSELIKYLEETAKAENITYLTGWVSPVDFDHKERLLHFYQKNGFEIKVKEDEMGGYSIRKLLS